MLEISLLMAVSLSMLAPIVIKEIKARQAQKEALLATAQYLMEIEEEISQLPINLYLQKRWLEENFTNEVTEIIQENSAVLEHLNRALTPNIFEIHETKERWFQDINQQFLEEEIEHYGDYFDTIESNPLTAMQRVAVVTHEENNLILAGAGSGKTSVIIAKVGYLLQRGYASADEILILAFNKKAQEELSNRVAKRLKTNITIQTFHALGKKIIAQSYQEESQNFEEMITLATQAIREGAYHSPYNYIFIDEFQDISSERNELILALKSLNSSNITVVGDDWQAINKFAGSDIEIIQNFEKYHGATALIKLDYTFRFNQDIANVSQKFILKNPKQITKEIKTLKETSSQSFYIYWYEHTKKIEEHTQKILQLIEKKISATGERKSIKILSRYRFCEPKNLTAWQEQFSHALDIDFHTIHGSKGLEADYVIITHLERGKFGFPSDNNLDNDEYLYAEERRLFYVALTRAKEKVFLLTHRKKTSSFIIELEQENKIYKIN
jgi:superfamily I DNA/RNA helicase